MRQTFTDGTEIAYDDLCDCGLTSGCEKCRPIILNTEKEIYYERKEDDYFFSNPNITVHSIFATD